MEQFCNESSHRLIEDEFYSQVMNPKLNEFLKEAEEYQIDFDVGGRIQP